MSFLFCLNDRVVSVCIRAPSAVLPARAHSIYMRHQLAYYRLFMSPQSDSHVAPLTCRPSLTHIYLSLTHIPPSLTHIPPNLTHVPPRMTHIPQYQLTELYGLLRFLRFLQ